MSIKVHYVVVGSTGSYEDVTRWNVAAYSDKAKAYEHRDNAHAEALQAIARHSDDFYFSEANRFDLNLSVSEQGVRYVVEQLLFVETELPDAGLFSAADSLFTKPYGLRHVAAPETTPFKSDFADKLRSALATS